MFHTLLWAGAYPSIDFSEGANTQTHTHTDKTHSLSCSHPTGKLVLPVPPAPQQRRGLQVILHRLSRHAPEKPDRIQTNSC